MHRVNQTRRGFRLVLGGLIFSTLLGCDQATKSMATRSLKGAPPISYLWDTVRLEYALNPGGFLSLGENLSPKVRQTLFIGLNACFLAVLALILILRWNLRLTVYVPLVCIFTGGIGNLIDRILNQGLVTDFLVVGIGSLRSGVFNVADMGVTFGAIAVLLLPHADKKGSA